VLLDTRFVSDKFMAMIGSTVYLCC